MKILYHHRTGSRDGQSVHIDDLIAALRSQGHEVIVAAPPATGKAAFGSGARWVETLKRLLPKAGYELLELAYSVIAFARLCRAYRRHRPDVLYERYNLFLLAGVWLSRWYGLPMLLEVNAPLAAERARFGGLALKGLADRVERATWRAAGQVLPVTRVLAGHLRAAGVDPARITVIANGVPADLPGQPADGTALRARLGLEDAIVLGFTGFVRDWHGLDRVLGVMAGEAHRWNLHLVLLGDGPARAALERRAADLGVADRFHCVGLVERERMAEHVAAFDIALQPAVVAYASPLKLFEYMALGRAVVAPDMPNIREVLEHGRNALLFDPADPSGLGTSIQSLCADADLRRRLGDAARNDISRRGLTWDANAARVAALATAMLDDRAYLLRTGVLDPKDGIDIPHSP